MSEIEALRREAEVLRAVDHPHIVKLVDVHEFEDQLVIITELMLGGELFNRLVTKGAYPEPRARLLAQRLLSAIAYLHERRIVHRDLKPENILLVSEDDDANAKIADFGVATHLEQRLKTFCGSPQYFAPEVLRRRDTTKGAGSYDDRADMWSFGVILYILLCGFPPYAPQTLERDLERVKISFRHARWDAVSEPAKDLVRSLL